MGDEDPPNVIDLAAGSSDSQDGEEQQQQQPESQQQQDQQQQKQRIREIEAEIASIDRQLSALHARQAALRAERDTLRRRAEADARAPRADWRRADFPWSARADAVLRDTFRLPGWRPLQREVVNATMAGRDALCLLPAGAGKSVCYQLPALLAPGGAVTLVVSPLLALIHDQVESLRKLGIAAAALTSATPKEDVQATYARMDGGRCVCVGGWVGGGRRGGGVGSILLEHPSPLCSGERRRQSISPTNAPNTTQHNMHHSRRRALDVLHAREGREQQALPLAPREAVQGRQAGAHRRRRGALRVAVGCARARASVSLTLLRARGRGARCVGLAFGWRWIQGALPKSQDLNSTH